MEDKVQTQMYVDLDQVNTVEDVMKMLVLAAHHHGNWQKPFTPEMLQPFIDKVLKLMSHQSIKDRKDELSHFEGWEEWFDRDNHTILTVNERRQALDNLHQKEIEG